MGWVCSGFSQPGASGPSAPMTNSPAAAATVSMSEPSGNRNR
jgi:hypothetical protein